MGKNKDVEQLAALDQLVYLNEIDEVIGVVKSGKEATVYACRGGATHGGRTIAAKVYRSTDVRRFANDAAYRHGRVYGERRVGRAIAAKSRAGREFAFADWVSAEYATLSLLYRAAADVPEPLSRSGSVILMEYIGDDDEPASPLSAVTLDRDEALRVLGLVLGNIELMLGCDRIHGDLSAYNVLYHGGRIAVIDFPQAVDPRVNNNALDLLTRDVNNVVRHFERYGFDVDAGRITQAMWRRFLQNEL